MADKQEQNREQDRQKSAAAGAGADSESKAQTGDPGRTPGKAEGDEQTIDESLRRQENG